MRLYIASCMHSGTLLPRGAHMLEFGTSNNPQLPTVMHLPVGTCAENGTLSGITNISRSPMAMQHDPEACVVLHDASPCSLCRCGRILASARSASISAIFLPA